MIFTAITMQTKDRGTNAPDRVHNTQYQKIYCPITLIIKICCGIYLLNRVLFAGEATTTEISAEPANSIAVDEQMDPEAVLAAAVDHQKKRLYEARKALEKAHEWTQAGEWDKAETLLNKTKKNLPLNTATADILVEIDALIRKILYAQANQALDQKQTETAHRLLQQFKQIAPQTLETKNQIEALEAKLKNPHNQNIYQISPAYATTREKIESLMVQGHAQYLNGDLDGARRTFREVEMLDSSHTEAKILQTRIARELGERGYLNHSKTRARMLKEVNDGWQRPQVFETSVDFNNTVVRNEGLLEKLSHIRIPHVSFSGAKLSRAIETLSEISVEADKTSSDTDQGVNIVLFDPSHLNPEVTITLRNLSLDRVLQFVTQSVNFQYDIDQDTVVVRPGEGSGTQSLETEFFPISRSTVVRLTGQFDSGDDSTPTDIFASDRATTRSFEPTQRDTESALKSFFQRAGVNFENVPEATLAYDGSQLIVTQTPRNLNRMANILRRYKDSKQVEIETKFLEVQQGALEEIGVSWNISDGPMRSVGTFDPLNPQKTNLRGLNTVFGGSRATGGRGTITLAGPGAAPGKTLNLDFTPPLIPMHLNLGAGGTPFARFEGSIGSVTIRALIHALEQTEGADLMSAPKVTVLSGKTARIVVAQELRYPESYGDIEAEVARGSSDGVINNSNGGVAITSGTPQDFVVRNVGVEMEVTPTVEEDDSISLILEPRVTEFEGFVEYGGPSVAISGNTTVNVPTGFFQPIFSTRTVQTEVTLYDGATVIMGGLTREQVISVQDKVPLLGDIPLIGRLFRSKGESSQKRNLLIFVTANLVSPGGSPARQDYAEVEPNALFQQPTIVTPGGAVNRTVDD